MANTYVQIGSTVTVGSGGAANMEFTSIPATYTDLIVVASMRSDAAVVSPNVKLQFNGSTTGYSERLVYGNGSAAASANRASTEIIYIYGNGSSATASTFGSLNVYIPNYASSNNKSVSADTVNENNATAATAGLDAGLWSNSAAITSIRLTPDSGSFVQYTTASLYGIKSS
jgi:hypothetical protein